MVKALQAAKVPFRAVSRDPAKAKQALGANVEVVAGDLDRPETLRGALGGASGVFFVSGVDERYTDRVKGFLGAAKSAGVKHVVKLGAMGADPASPTALLRQHAETDALVRASGMTWTLLRPNGFFQNLLWAAGSIKSQGKIFMAMKDARQALVDVRDVAQAGVKALTTRGHEGQTYELTGPAAPTYADIAATFARVLGKPVAYVDVPVAAACEGLKKAGFPAWSVAEIGKLYALFATGAAARTTDTVARVLGRPPTPLETWIREHLPAFR